MYRLYILKTKMQEQSVHHVSTQLCENINAIYGITKALPYTKRNENTAYRELKECITTAQS